MSWGGDKLRGGAELFVIILERHNVIPRKWLDHQCNFTIMCCHNWVYCIQEDHHGWLTLTSDTCEQSGDEAALRGCSDPILQGSPWSRTSGHYKAGFPKSIWNSAVPSPSFLHEKGKNWQILWARGDSDLERLPSLNSLSASREQEVGLKKKKRGWKYNDRLNWLHSSPACYCFNYPGHTYLMYHDACNWQLPLLQLYTSNTGVSLLFSPVFFFTSVIYFSQCLKAPEQRSYMQLVFLLFYYKLHLWKR